MKDNWKVSLQRITQYSAFILCPMALATLYFFDWKMSLSLVLGGLFAILNFIGIIWGVENVFALHGGKGKMIFMTFFRLMVLFSILLILLIFDIINIAGIAVGLSVVFLLILLEGFKRARQLSNA